MTSPRHPRLKVHRRWAKALQVNTEYHSAATQLVSGVWHRTIQH